jgi:hypothetical protein
LWDQRAQGCHIDTGSLICRASAEEIRLDTATAHQLELIFFNFFYQIQVF